MNLEPILRILCKFKNEPYTNSECSKCVFHSDCYFIKVAEQIASLQTDVVRCKVCSVPHNKWTGCPKLGGLVTPPEFFCAFGEPKQNQGNSETNGFVLCSKCEYSMFSDFEMECSKGYKGIVSSEDGCVKGKKRNNS